MIFNRRKNMPRNQNKLDPFVFFCVLLLLPFLLYGQMQKTQDLFVPEDPANQPMGNALGIYPGRVVWVWDSSATSWDGKTGYWWEDRFNSQEKIEAMLSQGLQHLTGERTDRQAWEALFKYFNLMHGKGNGGYRAGEKIAIKLNLNLIGNTNPPRNRSFPSPHVVLALTRQLVYQAGVSPEDITFYDTNRYVPDPIYNQCKKEFPGVHFMGFYATNGREKYVRDTTTIHWSEPLTLEIGGGHPAYLPTVVTQASYLINLANFKGHRYVGVTFCAKNHLGSFSADGDNGLPSTNAPKAAGLHPYIAVHDIIIPGSVEWSFFGRPFGTYNALVDLMGHKDLGGKTLLFLIDALYGVQSEQDDVSLKSQWVSSPFNHDWTSSLFLSQDGVAIESVGLDFYRTEQSQNPNIVCVYGAVDNYLHEAALAHAPPSGTVYDPEKDGIPLQSLGVHEHWNNENEKSYSRNLGTGDGIELVWVKPSETGVLEKEGQKYGDVLHNYPNPFNQGTTLVYSVPEPARVSLSIFDCKGRKIRTWIQEVALPGVYSIFWNGLDEKEIEVSSGIYIVRMEHAGSFHGIYNRKIIFEK